VLAADPETIGIIYDEAQQLSRLVDDLRTLSLSDAGELSVHRIPVSPRELLESAQAAHRATAAAHEIDLKLTCDPDLPFVDADPDRVTQVIHNLLNNALRYTPKGGTVTLSAEQQAGFVALSVADTGPGISQEQRKRVFERFYRGDPSRHRDSDTSGWAWPSPAHWSSRTAAESGSTAPRAKVPPSASPCPSPPIST
jgi:signal transduction histidine kinase